MTINTQSTSSFFAVSEIHSQKEPTKRSLKIYSPDKIGKFLNKLRSDRHTEVYVEKKARTFDNSSLTVQPATTSQIRLLNQIKVLFPQIEDKLLLKTLQYVEEHQDHLLGLRKTSKNAELPFAITLIQTNHFLIHLKKMSHDKESVEKGSYKICYGALEVFDTTVKKRAELYIIDAEKFEKEFPYFKNNFFSSRVMGPPLYEINHGVNKKSLIYPYYDCCLKTYLAQNNPSEQERMVIFTEYVLGIADIHEYDFVHRDLKEKNGLVKLDKNGKIKKIKVSDLDSVKKDDGSKGFFGTQEYLPYTVFTGKEIQTRKTDMYMLAKMAYGIFQLSWYGEEDDEELTPLQLMLEPLFKRLRSFRPDERPTARELANELLQIEADFFPKLMD